MKLTQKQKDAINRIIAAKTRISLDAEAVRDDTAALAAELGMKPSKISKLVALVQKEQNKGGQIEEQSQIIELATQVVG